MSTAVAQQRSKLKSGPSTSALLDELEDAVEQIIGAVAQFEHPELVRVDDWTVKDTLGHIAFWHDSFARNVAALTDGRKPDVLKGTYPDLNARGIAESRGQTAAQIAERIIAGLEHPIIHHGWPCRISGSIGITVSASYDEPTVDVMHADADKALYAAKRAGRRRWEVWRADLLPEQDCGRHLRR
jgi:hypothetical protein